LAVFVLSLILSLYFRFLYVYSSSFFLLLPPPPRSTLFPYTTLFRSLEDRLGRERAEFALNLVISLAQGVAQRPFNSFVDALHKLDRKSTRLNSSHVAISYAVFCLKKKKTKKQLDILYQQIKHLHLTT